MPAPATSPPHHLFAFAQAPRAEAVTVFIWVGVLIVALMIAGIVVLHLRAKLLAKDQAGSPASILEEIRAMRRRGEISDQEFEVMRRRIIERVAGKKTDSKATPVEVVPKPVAKPRGTPGGPIRSADGGLRAAPGVDLTGEPLPRPGGSTEIT